MRSISLNFHDWYTWILPKRTTLTAVGGHTERWQMGCIETSFGGWRRLPPSRSLLLIKDRDSSKAVQSIVSYHSCGSTRCEWEGISWLHCTVEQSKSCSTFCQDLRGQEEGLKRRQRSLISGFQLSRFVSHFYLHNGQRTATSKITNVEDRRDFSTLRGRFFVGNEISNIV